MAVLLAIFAATSVFIIHKNKKTYRYMIDKSEDAINEMKKQVYAATDDIKKGDMITEDNIYLKEIIISKDCDIWIDEYYMNQLLEVDIPKDMLITKNMVMNDNIKSEGLREVYVNSINITPNINLNDYCDIRIDYPNGESYIILSKKQILNINEAYSACCMKLNQEEYHLFLSGITDCKEYDGSSLVITKYINTDDTDSIITYQPSEESLALIYKEIEEDKRIGKHYSTDERMMLKQRLKVYMEGE